METSKTDNHVAYDELEQVFRSLGTPFPEIKMLDKDLLEPFEKAARNAEKLLEMIKALQAQTNLEAVHRILGRAKKSRQRGKTSGMKSVTRKNERDSL